MAIRKVSCFLMMLDMLKQSARNAVSISRKANVIYPFMATLAVAMPGFWEYLFSPSYHFQ